jgi:hypothetical protein
MNRLAPQRTHLRQSRKNPLDRFKSRRHVRDRIAPVNPKHPVLHPLHRLIPSQCAGREKLSDLRLDARVAQQRLEPRPRGLRQPDFQIRDPFMFHAAALTHPAAGTEIVFHPMQVQPPKPGNLTANQFQNTNPRRVRIAPVSTTPQQQPIAFNLTDSHRRIERAPIRKVSQKRKRKRREANGIANAGHQLATSNARDRQRKRRPADHKRAQSNQERTTPRNPANNLRRPASQSIKRNKSHSRTTNQSSTPQPPQPHGYDQRTDESLAAGLGRRDPQPPNRGAQKPAPET